MARSIAIIGMPVRPLESASLSEQLAQQSLHLIGGLGVLACVHKQTIDGCRARDKGTESLVGISMGYHPRA